ncbi:hypothetical protein CTAYLR_006126 [Chrysophaeum taylorii]|uniref:AB hydrolase-1 domain-containing protein n=1 Tax=Chrysophaeum taylorii TaxID=2483200 RepID=A0AAD7UP25_9STRA|nr:hypothetical protein CTAYLR_006126 [Chrysophaeum taylorii]
MLDVYAREYALYRKSHVSLGNLGLHAVLVPIEQACSLAIISRVWPPAFVVLQAAVSLATAVARRPVAAVAQGCVVALLRTSAAKAACVGLGSLALQVMVGHWLVDGNRPSAQRDGLGIWSVVFQIAVAWEAFGSAAWVAACRALTFMHWARAPSILRDLERPRRAFYSLSASNVRATTADGETLGGFVLAPPAATRRPADLRDAKRVVLFFHGNAGTRLGVFARRPSARVELCRALATLFDAFVVAFDYRGFADSTGSPSAEGLALDAVAAKTWCVGNAPRAALLVYGHSLGTAVASRLAAEHSDGIQALVLDAPFPSIATAAVHYPVVRAFVAVCRACGLLDQLVAALPDPFLNSAKHLPPHIPLLILHKVQDNVIPYHLGRIVYEEALAARRSASSNNKTFTRFVLIDEPDNIMRRHHVDTFTSRHWVAALDELFALLVEEDDDDAAHPPERRLSSSRDPLA